MKAMKVMKAMLVTSAPISSFLPSGTRVFEVLGVLRGRALSPRGGSYEFPGLTTTLRAFRGRSTDEVWVAVFPRVVPWRIRWHLQWDSALGSYLINFSTCVCACVCVCVCVWAATETSQ